MEYPWGIAATFKDPDGNLFSISQPPREWTQKTP
jgi:predicted enzyme related to lactoylglutathione lyase